MLWIKRNLFLVVSGAVVAVLLGLGGFYLYSSWSKNATVEGELEKNLALMTNLYNTVPFPHPTNVTVARDQLKLVKSKRSGLLPLFEPVTADRVSGLQFRTTLDRTIAELHRLAVQASVELPRSNYAFSFDGVRNNANFDPGSFPLMPQQLADIKVICGLLFESRARPLINIRRARVSRDDSASSTDYLEAHVETNALNNAVLSPYEFEFQCMSEDLATVLDRLSQSKHGFIVRNLRVESIVEKPDGQFMPPGMVPPDSGPGAPPGPGRPRPGQPGFQRNLPGNRSTTPAAAATAPATRKATGGTTGASDKLVTPLKERRIRVTLNIVSIRPDEGGRVDGERGPGGRGMGGQ